MLHNFNQISSPQRKSCHSPQHSDSHPHHLSIETDTHPLCSTFFHRRLSGKSDNYCHLLFFSLQIPPLGKHILQAISHPVKYGFHFTFTHSTLAHDFFDRQKIPVTEHKNFSLFFL